MNEYNFLLSEFLLCNLTLKIVSLKTEMFRSVILLFGIFLACSMNNAEFLDWLNDYLLLEKNSATWNL
jgi:hypothetical protein